QAHTIAFVAFSSDEELPWTIVHTGHRVSSIAEQVQDDLLKLDTIGCDERKIVGELRSEYHTMSLKLVHRQRNHLARRLVQVHRFRRELFPAEESAQSHDHIGCAVGVANRSPRCLARAVE